MATRDDTREAKSRLLGKGRKIAKDLDRYATYGYVDQHANDYAADDRKLSRAIDSLYELARKNGLADDSELQQVRMQLRERYVDVRNNAAPRARQQLNQGAIDAHDRRAREKRAADAGMSGYLDELKLGEARRSARRRGG